MKYRDNAQLDSSQVSGGGGGNGGKIAIGGGASLVVIVIALLLGIRPDTLLGAGDPTESQTPGAGYTQCTSGADVAKNRECRFVAYTNSIQSFWKSQLRGYQVIQTRTFTGRVSTACGTATSAVGPFYCPSDTTVYLDTGFFDDLESQYGAKGGDAAEAYVFAHEFGHHIQNLSGTMRRVQSEGQGTGPKSAGVRLELQADCYAGVWMKRGTADPNSPVAEFSADDLNRAVDAAAAVGDDRIQQKTQGQVTPETFSHGTSAQRQKWLGRGFSTGDPNQCDTFGTSSL